MAATPQVRISTRDYEDLRARLESWIRTRLPAAAEPVVTSVEAPGGNGMSSETVTFELITNAGGERESQRCVARLEPQESAVPVFPTYDLERQFRVMRLVGAHSAVPVPRTLWCEPSPGPVGSPLFVMERVDGMIPPDVLPYNFGSWLSEAEQADRARLQESTIAVLAGIHAVDVVQEELDFLQFDRPGPTPLRRHVADQWDYYQWIAADRRHPLIERGFAWLERHWPAAEGPAVISWGDARIGNIVYRDCVPVGILDWEMAAVGPRELDLGWIIYHHRFFEDLAAMAQQPGLPDFLRRDDVAAAYEAATGYRPRDLDFFITYAAIRNAVVMARIAQRQIVLGERGDPDDPDEVFYDRAALEALLAGTYWNGHAEERKSRRK